MFLQTQFLNGFFSKFCVVNSAAEVSKVCEYLTELPQKVKRPTTPNTFGGNAPGMKAWLFWGWEGSRDTKRSKDDNS